MGLKATKLPNKRQTGAILVLAAIGMIAIIAMLALMFDNSHAFVNKTRLQNMVDAAALSAAKIVDASNDVVAARQAALNIFQDNAGGSGNIEVARALNDGNIVVNVEFSANLQPFVAGSVPPRFARVRVDDFDLQQWFLPVLGTADKTVGASAVAGPSPTIGNACNVAPMMVCGDPADPPNWGYTPGELDVLKMSSNNSDVGPGNFQLIRFPGGQGGAEVRINMAGGYDGCINGGSSIDTEPGNTVGPVVQGINTRFGIYHGPLGGSQSIYPPDVVVSQPSPPLTYDSDTDEISQGGSVVVNGNDIDFDFGNYTNAINSQAWNYPPAPNGIGAYKRRELALPIGDCSTTTNGQGEVPLLGFGCYFLLQEAKQKGNESHIYGQFITNCVAGGVPGPNPGGGPGPYIIQLYRDVTTEDS